MYTNQQGRSMIEMLGVLAIIGVLSVGGLTVVGKARRQQEITKALSEVSQLAESSKKLGCGYETAYGDVANMIGQSEAYPSGLEFNYVKNDSYFILSSDIEAHIPYVAGTSGEGEKAMPHFVIMLTNMDEDMCVNLATSDWGRKSSNGYIGASFSSNSDFDGMKNNYPRMDPGAAATGCVNESTKLYLGFRICH